MAFPDYGSHCRIRAWNFFRYLLYIVQQVRYRSANSQENSMKIAITNHTHTIPAPVAFGLACTYRTWRMSAVTGFVLVLDERHAS